LNFNFFYDKITGFSLKFGSPTFELAGYGQQFLKIAGGHGQRAAKCHGLFTSNPDPPVVF
jgi:hypothetical protein